MDGRTVLLFCVTALACILYHFERYPALHATIDL